MGALLIMSTKELDRLAVFERIKSKELSQAKASHILGLSARHLSRLYHVYMNQGPSALTSKKRGKPSNRAYAPELKQYALYLIKENYHDFGPTLIVEKLEDILTWQEDRTVSNSLTIQYDRVVYLLEPNDITLDLKRKRVSVYDYPDGTIDIRYQGLSLPYSVFDKVQQVHQADIVSNKRLGAVLQFAKEKQKEMGYERSKKGPSRRGQKASRKANPAV